MVIFHSYVSLPEGNMQVLSSCNYDGVPMGSFFGVCNEKNAPFPIHWVRQYPHIRLVTRHFCTFYSPLNLGSTVVNWIPIPRQPNISQYVSLYPNISQCIPIDVSMFAPQNFTISSAQDMHPRWARSLTYFKGTFFWHVAPKMFIRNQWGKK